MIAARALLLAAALLGVGAGRHRDPLAGRVSGPARDCIDLASNEGPTITEDRAILYRDGARIWRSTPTGACPSLRPMTTLIVDIYGGQLCRDDRFRVLEPGTTIPSAYCRFGAFTPYTTPPR